MKHIVKMLILTFVLLSFLSCTNNVSTQSTKYIIDGNGVKLRILDSCEYIQVGSGNSVWGTHKGNCSFCLMRNKKRSH